MNFRVHAQVLPFIWHAVIDVLEIQGIREIGDVLLDFVTVRGVGMDFKDTDIAVELMIRHFFFQYLFHGICDFPRCFGV